MTPHSVTRSLLRRPTRCVTLVLLSTIPQAQLETAAGPPAGQAGFYWADADGDALADAFVITADREARLLRNLGDGTLEDVTLRAGLGGVVAPMFAAWQDYDCDGDQDLYVGTLSGSGHLFQALGDGSFIDVTVNAGLEHDGRALHGGFLDYDADGRFDLHVRTVGADWLYHNLGGGLFARVELGLPTTALEAQQSAAVSLPGSASDMTASESLASPASSAPVLGAVSPSDRTPLVPQGHGSAREAGSNGVAREGAPILGGPGVLGPFEDAGAFCAPSIANQAGGCLLASTTPTIGMLYPLSSNLFVDSATGFVGMNTLTPDYRLDVATTSTSEGAAARGVSVQAARGFLGVQGKVDFDGLASADWSSLEIGVAGTSTGATASDNFGVVGHANGAGVRGEFSDDPNGTWGELGARQGYGLRASGTAGAAQLDGNVEVANGDFVVFEGPVPAARLGSTSVNGGTLVLRDPANTDVFEVYADVGTGAQVRISNEAGLETLNLDSDANGAGLVTLRNAAGGNRLVLDGGATDDGADLTLLAADGSTTLLLDGNSATDAGEISVRNDSSQETIRLVGDNGVFSSGEIRLTDRQTSETSAILAARTVAGVGGRLQLFANSTAPTVDVDGDNLGGGILLRETDGSTSCDLVGSLYSFHDSSGTLTWSVDRQTGTESAAAATANDGARAFYGMRSPEVWFEDFGSSRLVDGTRVVSLERIFRECVTIDAANKMKVFVTLNGESEGVWIEKGDGYFVVHERHGGTSNVAFDWRVVAKRKGEEAKRNEDLGALAAADAEHLADAR